MVAETTGCFLKNGVFDVAEAILYLRHPDKIIDAEIVIHYRELVRKFYDLLPGGDAWVIRHVRQQLDHCIVIEDPFAAKRLILHAELTS
ncbi:hypothetical protein D3C86_1799530 [compost metagenome]